MNSDHKSEKKICFQRYRLTQYQQGRQKIALVFRNIMFSNSKIPATLYDTQEYGYFTAGCN
jgi:hypothetical protein